jgi:hypothetical protein
MPFSKLNFINVGSGGTFKPSGQFRTLPEDVDEVFAALERDASARLTLHFHGGLVPEKKGMEVAERMFGEYSTAKSHPLAFVWETGLLTTLRDNLTSISKSKLFKKLLTFVIKQAAKRVGIEIGRGGGTMTEAEIQVELAKDRPFEHLDRAVAARGGAEITSVQKLDDVQPEILEELEADVDNAEFQALLDAERDTLAPDVAAAVTPGPGRGGLLVIAKYLATITYRVVKRYVQKRNHEFYPTVVEEILREIYLADLGERLWGGMKKKAEQMWLPNDGLVGEAQHAGTYFLDRLAAHLQRFPQLKVDAVAHSAGSVAVIHMLEAMKARHPTLKLRNVIFLAPACRLDLFHERLIPHVPARVAEFRMYTMSDEYERKDSLVRGVYTASLLYLISGILEQEVDTPIAGMHRFLQGSEPFNGNPYDESRAFLKAPGILVLAVTDQGAAAGLQSTATAHGDFDEDVSTLGSLKHLIGM